MCRKIWTVLKKNDLSLRFNPSVSEDKRIQVSGNTYRKNAEVVALQGLEHIGNSSLQSSIDEDPIAEVIQQNDPQGVHVACHPWHEATAVKPTSHVSWSYFSFLEGAHFSVAQSHWGSDHRRPRRWGRRWWRNLPALADQSSLLLPSETGKSYSRNKTAWSRRSGPQQDLVKEAVSILKQAPFSPLN